MTCDNAQRTIELVQAAVAVHKGDEVKVHVSIGRGWRRGSLVGCSLRHTVALNGIP